MVKLTYHLRRGFAPPPCPSLAPAAGIAGVGCRARIGREPRRYRAEMTRAGRSAPGSNHSGPPSVLYWQIGAPSFVEPPPSEIVQVFAVEFCEADAVQPVFVALLIVTVTPLDAW